MDVHNRRLKELNDYLREIPEEMTFTGSDKAKFKSLALALLGLCIEVVMVLRYLEGASGKGIVIIFGVITVLFIFMAIKQWNDGAISIVKFTHTALLIKDINNPIPLEQVSDISYTYDDRDTLKIYLKDNVKDLALTSKINSLRGASVSLLRENNRQVIVIIVPYSFNDNGKRLSPEEVGGVFEKYLSIPEVKSEIISLT